MTARAIVRLTSGETVEGVLDFYLAFTPANAAGVKQAVNTTRANEFLSRVKGLFTLGENGRPTTPLLDLTTPTGSRLIVAGEAVLSVEVVDAEEAPGEGPGA